MRIRRLHVAGAIAAATALLLTACSGASQGDDTDSSKPQRGGTLRIAYRAEPVQLNPLVDQGSGASVVRPLVDSLVWDNGDGTYEPWLAESWEVSDDAKTYTFHLRDDVTFQDGTKLDADAVKTNFDYVADPANKSTGSVAKLHPVTKTLDADTVEVTLDSPESSFLTLVAAPYFGIISAKQITEDPGSLSEKVIGTGPFELQKWTKGQSMTYVRNPDYDWAPKGFHEGAAYLDEITIQFLTEDQVRYDSLTSGQSDVIDYVPAEHIAEAKELPDVTTEETLLPGVGYSLQMNTRKAPFDDVDVRKALLTGLDRKGIVDAATFSQYPTQEYLSTTTPDYEKDLQNTIEHSTKEAGKLLDGAGWDERDDDGYRVKDGKRLAARIPFVQADQLNQRVLEQTQADAKKLGFDLTLDPVTDADYAKIMYNGDYGILATFQSEATGMQLWRLYGSDNISKDGAIGSNASFISDPELDGILAEARSAADAGQRAEYYGQAQELLPSLAPSVPLYSRPRVIAARSNVHGLALDKSWPQAYLFDVWLS